MPPVYGDMLAAFPELMNQIAIFSMKPKVGGGYEPRVHLFYVRGAFIRGMKNREKIQGENRVANQSGMLICFDHIPQGAVQQGCYFEDAGEVFQAVDDQQYAREGGFSVYSGQLVQGLTDQQHENPATENIVISDYTV